MPRIITKRAQATVQAFEYLGEKFGVRTGRPTRDAIGALRLSTNRCFEPDGYLCFVDYENLFDRVDRKK